MKFRWYRRKKNNVIGCKVEYVIIDILNFNYGIVFIVDIDRYKIYYRINY